MNPLLLRLAEEIEQFQKHIRDLPVAPAVDPEEIRTHLDTAWDLERAHSADAVLDEVTAMFRQWHTQVTHPRYFGLFNPSVTLPSVIGDSLAAVYNPQLAVWSHSPVANELERHTLRFLARQLGMDPNEVQANFTSGGAEANFTAVVVALSATIDGFAERGTGELQPRIYVSAEAHHSFHKTAVMCGLGGRAIRTIPVDADLKMIPEELERAIEEDREKGMLPLMGVATAGTTSAGVIDPIAGVAEICRRQGLWLHVDAAWGGSAMLVPRLRPLFVGIEDADSLTWDAHKWLSVPMGAGMFFCRRPEAVRDAFALSTAYMPAGEEGTIDPYASTVQWSRRSIGMKLFFSLATIGREGYERMIEHQIEMADELRRALVARGWTILNDSPLAVVCFSHPRLPDHAALAAFAHRVQREGTVWISPTTLGETTPALRACVTSFRTEREDIDVLLARLDRHLEDEPL